MNVRHDEDDVNQVDCESRALERALPSWSQSFPVILRGYLFPPLAALYRIRYERYGQLDDLQASIRLYLATLATAPPDHSSLPFYKQRLAVNLFRRFKHLGDVKDLQLSLMLQMAALGKVSENDSDIEWYRQSLVLTRHAKYEKLQQLSDLEALLSFSSAALSTLPDNSPYRVWWMLRLADFHYARFSRLQEESDADAELEWSLAALEASPPTQLAGSRAQIGTSYWHRYRRSRSVDDLELALFWAHSSLDITPKNDVNHFVRLQQLGNLYEDQFKVTGSPDHLEKAITYGQQCIDIIPKNHRSLPPCFYNMAYYYFTKFTQQGSLADADLSIKWCEKAIQSAKPDDFYLGTYYSQLAKTHLEMYFRGGNLGDIESAIHYGQKGSKVLGNDHSTSHNIQYDLAVILFHRYRRHRNPDDLDAAFEWVQMSLDISDKNIELRKLLSRRELLALLNKERFTITKDPQYIFKALEIQQDVVDRTLLNDPDLCVGYATLGSIHATIYASIGGREHRDGILPCTEAALKYARPDDINLSRYTTSVARQRYHRYLRLRDEEDLRVAARVGREALHVAPQDHPSTMFTYELLAEIYSDMHSLSKSVEDAEEALCNYRSASRFENGSPPGLWSIADKWASFADHLKSAECLEAYGTGYQVLPELLWLGSSIADRHQTMVRYDIGSVTAKAIRACIQYKNYPLAVEFLEQSLGITFQQLLDLKSDLSDLEDKLPELAGRLEKLSKELQKSSTSTLQDQDLAARSSQAWDKQRELAIERADLLKQIRQEPGFGNFLRPLPFQTLASAASGGPVIIINCSGFQGDALVVFPGGKTHHVHLPRVIDSRLREYYDILRGALKFHGIHTRKAEHFDDESEDMRAGRIARRKGVDGVALLQSVLDWLWTYVVSPVFSVLQQEGYTEGRIWWCLTGLLRNLPVHAAGPPNDYVQSYTSTLSALIRARADSSTADTNVTAIGLSEFGTTQTKPLPSVKVEMEVLRDVVGTRALLIMNQEASLERITEHLPYANWLHLACHGQQGDTRSPLRSGLLLYGGQKLELGKIISTDMPDAEFVFLSACETAMGDSDMANESLHLAGGMIFAGFKAAIGTLWAINDRDGPIVARAVYSHVFKEGKPNVRKTANALHLAIRALRDSGTPPHRWVPFIHIGI